MHKTTGAFLSLAAACLLASCVSSGRHNGLAPSVPNRAGEYRLPPAGTYRIDPDRSELRFLVYRAGALGGARCRSKTRCG